MMDTSRHSYAILTAQSLDFVKALNAHHYYDPAFHGDMLREAAGVGNIEIVEYELERCGDASADLHTHALRYAKCYKRYDIAELW